MKKSTKRETYSLIVLSILNDSGPLTLQQINKKIYFGYQEKLEELDSVWNYQHDIASVRKYLVDNKFITKKGTLFSLV